MMADFLQNAVKARFVKSVLQEEGERMLEQQGRQIITRTKRRTGRLYSGRYIRVYGGSDDFDGVLTFTHTVYERFLDMKRVSGRSSGTRTIHNRFVMRAFGKIAYRLMNEYTEEMQQRMRREFEAIRARFLQ